MEQTTENKAIERLSRIAAMTFVQARAFNLWNKKLESQALRLRQVHTHETKVALNAIAEGCKKASVGLKHFEEWAITSGITESGHMYDEEALNAYLTDGAWIAYLAGATFNAAKYDDTIRFFIENLCKNKTTGEPLIDWDELAELRPK